MTCIVAMFLSCGVVFGFVLLVLTAAVLFHEIYWAVISQTYLCHA